MCTRTLSQTMWITVMADGVVRSISSSSSMNSFCRLRLRQMPRTFPVRVSMAASRLIAPLRSYSCSTSTGRPGWAGRVGETRGRGWSEVFSSTQRTTSFGAKGRV